MAYCQIPKNGHWLKYSSSSQFESEMGEHVLVRSRSKALNMIRFFSIQTEEDAGLQPEGGYPIF